MSNNKEFDIYVGLLKGQRSRGRYKNSNLIIVDKLAKSVEERTINNISPPTNLNPDYSRPVKKIKQNKKSNQEVDPRILRAILR